MKCFRCLSNANEYVDEDEHEHTSNDIQKSAAFIAEWKEHYTSAKKAQHYFMSLYKMNFENNAASALVVQLNVTGALAQIYVKKDHPNLFSEAYGELYRWVFRHDDLVLPKDGKYRAFDQLVADPRNNRTKQGVMKLPSDYKLMLQLRINKKWKDWVYIAESTRRGAHYGVFAGRDFCSQTIIGFYMGPIKWRATVEGGWEASPDELTASGVPESNYALQIRDKDCRFVMVDPASIRSVDKNEIEEVSLYMGMHYMNNPCMTFKRGTPGYIAAAKDNNCLLLDDGCVQAIKKIKPNTELLTGYQRDQIYRRKDSDLDKKPAAKKKSALPKKRGRPPKKSVPPPKKRGRPPSKKLVLPPKKLVQPPKKSMPLLKKFAPPSKQSSMQAKKSAPLQKEVASKNASEENMPRAKNISRKQTGAESKTRILPVRSAKNFNI